MLSCISEKGWWLNFAKRFWCVNLRNATKNYAHTLKMDRLSSKWMRPHMRVKRDQLQMHAIIHATYIIFALCKNLNRLVMNKNKTKNNIAPTTTPVNTKRRQMCGGHQIVENDRPMCNTWQLNVQQQQVVQSKYHYRRMSTSRYMLRDLYIRCYCSWNHLLVCRVCVLIAIHLKELIDSMDCHTESYVFQSLFYDIDTVLNAFGSSIMWLTLCESRIFWLRSIL